MEGLCKGRQEEFLWILTAWLHVKLRQKPAVHMIPCMLSHPALLTSETRA